MTSPPRRGAPVAAAVAGLAVQRFAAVGPPRGDVVFVHGAMDRGGGFRRVTRHLDEWNVTTYDRRGYDGSRSVPSSARLADHVADLVEVASSCPTPPLVVGHSQGGLIALHAAAGIGRSGVGPFGGLLVWEPPLTWFDWYRSDTVSDDIAATVLTDVAGDAAERFMVAVIGESMWNRLPERMRAERRAEGPALLADIAAARGADAPVEFDDIAVAVTAGAGTRSAPRHRRAAATVAERVLGARLVELDGADHGAHLSQPRAFAELIVDCVANRFGVGDTYR